MRLIGPIALMRIGWRDWFGQDDNVNGLVRAYGKTLYALAQGNAVTAEDGIGMVADQIAGIIGQPRPDLPKLLAIELQLTRMLPVDAQMREAWIVRERFERVASPRAIAAYNASSPPKLPAGVARIDDATAAEIGDDTRTLLSYIHSNYLMNLAREATVRELKLWVIRSTGAGILVFAGLLCLLYLILQIQGIQATDRLRGAFPFCAGIIMIFVFGRLGAIMSFTRRLQAAVGDNVLDQDPFFEIAALCNGRSGMRIAMHSGGVFAILLYCVFAAGMGEQLGVAGGLFPSPGPVAQGARHPGSASPAAVPPAPAVPGPRIVAGTIDSDDPAERILIQMAVALGFAGRSDVFKMLLLAFAAGFAERLVPDALDRLINRADPAAAKKGKPPSK